MKNDTIWLQNINFPRFPALNENIKTEIAIIGGGISGLTLAYLLAKAGHKVCLIEKETLCVGETACTTAFLSYYIDCGISNLAKKLNERKAKEVFLSAKDAIDEIEKIVQKENIDCEFERCPMYVLPKKIKDLKGLENEEKVAQRLGFAFKLEKKDIGLFSNKYLTIDECAKFHPLKYAEGLINKSLELGVLFYENSQVVSYEGKNPVLVKTRDGEIKAKHVVLCTHNPIDKVIEVQTRITPFQTYIVAGNLFNGPESGLYIDTDNPYNYLRIDQKNDKKTFLFGGQDHKTGETSKSDPYKKLEKALNNFILQSKFEITNFWSGQIIESVDCVPFIGPLLTNKKILVSTAFAGDGIVFGTLSAIINSDIIQKKLNPYKKIYAINRLKSSGKILNRQSEVIKDFINGSSEDNDIKNLAFDSGKVIKEDNQEVAVYKSKTGEIKKYSAKCTHMGCSVKWNNIDKTWDCPCHGSRFNKSGSVQTAPATKPLKKYN